MHCHEFANSIFGTVSRVLNSEFWVLSQQFPEPGTENLELVALLSSPVILLWYTGVGQPGPAGAMEAVQGLEIGYGRSGVLSLRHGVSSDRVIELLPIATQSAPSGVITSPSCSREDHMRSFLSMADLTRGDLSEILARAAVLKEEISRGQWRAELHQKTVVLLFQKPSLRTRVSFEQGIRQLGGYPLYLSPAEVGLGERESVPDVARVLSRYVDCIVARTNRHADQELLASHASIPVVNALSDVSHPCQCLADLLTIREKKGRFAGLVLAYIGDGNNVAHSLILGTAKVGIHLRIACPAGYEPSRQFVGMAAPDREATGATLTVVRSPVEAADGADILYTDVWTSMGQEAENQLRQEAFAGYRIDRELVKAARPDAIVMHDLPAHRGEEIEDEVIDGPRSVVFDQAENRLHAQKALLSWLFTRP